MIRKYSQILIIKWLWCCILRKMKSRSEGMGLLRIVLSHTFIATQVIWLELPF